MIVDVAADEKNFARDQLTTRRWAVVEVRQISALSTISTSVFDFFAAFCGDISAKILIKWIAVVKYSSVVAR